MCINGRSCNNDSYCAAQKRKKVTKEGILKRLKRHKFKAYFCSTTEKFVAEKPHEKYLGENLNQIFKLVFQL